MSPGKDVAMFTVAWSGHKDLQTYKTFINMTCYMLQVNLQPLLWINFGPQQPQQELLAGFDGILIPLCCILTVT